MWRGRDMWACWEGVWLHVLSADAVARHWPVMSKAMSSTSSVCPRRVVMTSPEEESHNLQVWSMEAVAMTDPLKLKMALEISPR